MFNHKLLHIAGACKWCFKKKPKLKIFTFMNSSSMFTSVSKNQTN